MEKPNYTQVPNSYIDEHMAALSPTAAKVMIAICRKTIGWHKVTDRISYSQLQQLTGIVSHNTLKKSIRELTEAGLITTERGKGKTTVFDLLMDTAMSKNDIDYVNNCPSTMSNFDSTKETLKETLQKKEEKRIKHGEVVTLTSTQYEKLCYQYGKKATDSKVDDINNYCLSRGRRYKDYAATVRAWFKKDGVAAKSGEVKRCARGHLYTGEICEQCI